MENVFEKQNKLQDQGRRLLEKLGILDLLGKYGEVRIVGSMDLGLMTWGDIDLDVAVEEKFSHEDFFEVVKELFAKKENQNVILADNRELSEALKAQKIPPSFYLGWQGEFEGAAWKMDIRFLIGGFEENEEKEVFLKKVKAASPEEREVILKIKSEVCQWPEYQNKQVFSVDVYRAVLEEGIRSAGEFKKSN
jgi:hypothetical protein